MKEAPLSLEKYAEIMGQLVLHRARSIENVLGSLGVSVEDFRTADEHYHPQLAACAAGRKGVLAMTFASAFAKARGTRSLFDAAPPPDEPSPPPEQAAPTAVATPSYMSQTAQSVSNPVRSPSFDAPPPAAAPMPPAVAPMPPAAAPAQPRTRGRTLDSGAVPANPSAQLPFRPGQPAIAHQASPAPTRAGRASTGTEDVALSELVSSAPLPFKPGAAAAPAGTLSLEYFAALTVDVAATPADLGAVLRRYGLSGMEDLGRVSAAWQAQMRSDPAVRARFDALVAQVRAARAGQRQR